MMKYVIVACLCLMLVLGQAKSQDQQETTTDKRVERDVDKNQMPGQGLPFPGQFPDMINKGIEDIQRAITGTMENVKEPMSNFGSRRRRSSEKH
ncbi:hypothetical protein HZH66_002031 [Vespula vulgaris]|uniref:Uncharacterized protein n=1 Tax=Vespula vulgaris TaxID=7454 RepID=A0A834NGW8_VESVU|nr:hypothetical protein HZH66_002031 [Vespula vulgaris]